jgi:murein DD-endopeptidase MepM/ murein hydrolase activator NlpD
MPLLGLLALGACSDSEAKTTNDASPGFYITWIPDETATPTVTVTKPTFEKQTATEESRPTSPPWTETPRPESVGVRGFDFPIAGACLPSSDNLMPGAPRDYRAGVHEGVDFYNGYNCVTVGNGTSVLAAKRGTVVRADRSYTNLTQADLDAALHAAIASGGTDQASLDTFRGRQVWIEHGDGTVTRYAHLSGIAPGIAAGDIVEAGDLIGYVGESGTPESVTNPGTEYHLHFEIRIGGSYLGAGQSASEVRRLYQLAFS